MVKDKIGQEISPGAYVAYGHVWGSSGGLRIGQVLSVETGVEAGGHRAGLPWFKIRVWAIDDDWAPNEPRRLKRPGTLQYPDRIIVLPVTQVPAVYRELLKGVDLE